MKKKNIIRMAIITIIILLIPLVAMQFTTEVDWDIADFIIMAILLFGAGMIYEFLASRSSRTKYRIAVSIAVLAVLLLVWMNGAVGIIGSEDNPANLMFFAIPLIGIVGVVLIRFRPQKMFYVAAAMAIAQFLVPLIALFIWPAKANIWSSGVWQILLLNLFFVVLYSVSALLFKQVSDNEVHKD